MTTLLFLLIPLGIPIILVIFGLSKIKSDPETAKKLFILAGIYLLIAAGICYTLMNGLKGL